jgi:hypothetical protein
MLARAWVGLPNSSDQAVNNVKTGQIRLHNKEYILIPVISLRPTVEFSTAEWWFLLKTIRGPLLSLSYVFSGDRHHFWAVAFGVAAFMQANLQDDFALSFLAATPTDNVTWFRRMPLLTYTEVMAQYTCRRALG